MNFNMAEIDLLRITGWLKALPLELRRFDIPMLSPAGIDTLCHYNLLHLTQNGQSLRLTPSGWDFLSAIGYSYPKDSRYVTKPEKVLRRNEAAQIMFTCYRAGIDIFADTPDCLSNSPTYQADWTRLSRRHAAGSGNAGGGGNAGTIACALYRNSKPPTHTALEV